MTRQLKVNRKSSADSDSPVTSAEYQIFIDDCVAYTKEIFDEIRHTKKVPILDIRRHVIPLILQMTEQQNLYGLFAALQSKDDYSYRHSVGVGIVAALMGKWLSLNKSDLMQLATAATLHDVGKLQIPLEILHKPEKLTFEEYELTKKHTIFGYEMMKETVGTNHRQALVALQHHERHDGSGYPLGIKANKIDLFSRIVAVADVFHAITSDRSYRNAASFYEMLMQMHQDAFGILDARIVHLLMNKMTQSLVGNDVLLTDGRTGSIIMINPLDPIRPLLRVEESFVDLSKESTLHIQRVTA